MDEEELFFERVYQVCKKAAEAGETRVVFRIDDAEHLIRKHPKYDPVKHEFPDNPGIRTHKKDE